MASQVYSMELRGLGGKMAPGPSR